MKIYYGGNGKDMFGIEDVLEDDEVNAADDDMDDVNSDENEIGGTGSYLEIARSLTGLASSERKQN